MLTAMYASFFGLQHAPFSIAPDPRYLFMSERHREALAHLVYGVGAGGGFVLLSGEIGAGKTTVCRCFLEQLPARCRVAYIFNPKLSVPELLQTVCDELGLAVVPPTGSAATVKNYTDALNAFLLQAHAQGESCVLIIDEAQNLSAEVLEQLRLLTNLETNERKLLQIILIGQPELRELLAQPALEQLAQRVVARFHLQALTPDETAQYVSHRLGVAGRVGESPFDTAALQRIHQISRGVPRRINLLCDRALLGAFSQGRHRVDRGLVEQAAKEVFDEQRPRVQGPALQATRSWLPGLGLGLAAGLALGAALALSAPWWRSPDVLVQAGAGPAGPVSAAGRGAAAALPGTTGAPQRAPGGAAARPLAIDAVGVPGPGGSAAAAGQTGLALAASASAPPTGAAGAFPAGGASSAAGRAVVSDQAGLRPVAPEDWWADDAGAWRVLAQAWGAVVPPSALDGCAWLLARQLNCQRLRGSLALIGQLDRPVLLTLHDDSGRSGQVLLLAFVGEQVVIETRQGTRRLSLVSLAQQWRGDFATLWRSEGRYTGLLGEGSRGPAVARLAAQLDRATGAPRRGEPADAFDAALKSRLLAFQAAQGLTPDGLAGPTTFMQLNRATGLAEPRLRSGN